MRAFSVMDMTRKNQSSLLHSKAVIAKYISVYCF